MQPDEPEARHCRKEKNAMAKSPKSKCCKVDAVRYRVCLEAVCFILVCTDFPDNVGSLFMS
jgi:hypothetical protein